MILSFPGLRFPVELTRKTRARNSRMWCCRGVMDVKWDCTRNPNDKHYGKKEIKIFKTKSEPSLCSCGIFFKPSLWINVINKALQDIFAGSMLCPSRNEVVSRIFLRDTKTRLCEDILPPLHDIIVCRRARSCGVVNGLSSCWNREKKETDWSKWSYIGEFVV